MNKILLLIVVILSFLAIGSIKEDTTSFNYEDKVEEVKIAVKSEDEILNIDLEEYVLGVVAGEMPASFHEEALKAQAVSARTYALYKMNNSKANYDVVTDVTNQVYISVRKMKEMWGSNYEYYYNKIKKAVKDTEYLVMTYNGEIICSMYFSTSNGYTEDAKQVFGTNQEYLKSVSSPEEESIKTVSIEKNEFCQKLGISCNDIKISNIKKNTSGRVDSLDINNKSFKGTELRTKLGLRSTDIEIEVSDKVNITTKGYGHGVGMSQYGANKLASQGKTYEEILKYYYQNIDIVKNNV